MRKSVPRSNRPDHGLLAVELRMELRIDPSTHSDGQSRLSAASGLAPADGCAFVVADDAHHLGVFRDNAPLGHLIRLLPGDLPVPKPARKRLKPDFESLVRLPADSVLPNGALNGPIRQLDRSSFYAPLVDLLGDINIEGAMILDGEFALPNLGGREAAIAMVTDADDPQVCSVMLHAHLTLPIACV